MARTQTAACGAQGAAGATLGTPAGHGARCPSSACSAGRGGLSIGAAVYRFALFPRFRRRVGTAKPRRAPGQRRQGAGIALASGKASFAGEAGGERSHCLRR